MKNGIDVLLINPHEWQTPIHYYALPELSYPLGLGYIATILKNHSFNVKIWDLGMAPKTSQIIATLKELSPKIVGISAMSSNFHSAIKVAHLVKSVNQDILVVLGGIHPTFEYEHCLRNFSCMDVIVLYEGEYTMLELTQYYYMEGSRSYDAIKGIAYRDGEEIKRTPSRPIIANLDGLPFPDRDLSIKPLSAKGTTMLSSRGCPYSCHFCSTSLYWGHRYRYRSPSNLVDEMEFLHDKYRIIEFNFVDDLFTIPRSRIIEFCRELQRRHLQIEWSCSTRVDAVDAELLEIMKESGCKKIFYGLESIEDEALRAMNKRISRKQIEEAIEATKRVDIKVIEAFILGLPNQSLKGLQEMIQFLRSTSPLRPNLCILKLHMNTEFHANPHKYGIHVYTPPSGSFYGNLNTYALDHTNNSVYPSDILLTLLDTFKLYSPIAWLEIPSPKVLCED